MPGHCKSAWRGDGWNLRRSSFPRDASLVRRGHNPPFAMAPWSTIRSTLRSRPRVSLAGVAAAVAGPVLGVAYMIAMAVWAGRAAALDEREGGAQARQIDAIVHGPFGGEVHRMEMAIAAAAVVVGVLLGLGASALLALHDRVAAAPSRRSWWSHVAILAALIVALEGGIALWAMAQHPQLYASVWYARGGWRRTAQLLATDVLGPKGALWLVWIWCAAFVAGPVGRWRGGRKGRRTRRSSSRPASKPSRRDPGAGGACSPCSSPSAARSCSSARRSRTHPLRTPGPRAQPARPPDRSMDPTPRRPPRSVRRRRGGGRTSSSSPPTRSAPTGSIRGRRRTSRPWPTGGRASIAPMSLCRGPFRHG